MVIKQTRYGLPTDPYRRYVKELETHPERRVGDPSRRYGQGPSDDLREGRDRQGLDREHDRRERVISEAVWPPKVGERIHYNSGHRITSWSGVVVAFVESDGVLVVRQWFRRKCRYHVFKLRKGGLPRRLT